MPASREVFLRAITTEDGRGLLEFRRDVERAAEGADKLGGKFKSTTRDAKALDEQIVRTKDRIRDLDLQISRTGDKSLFGDVRRERATLRELEKIKAEIAAFATLELFGGKGPGGGIGKGLAEALGGLPSKLKGTAIVAAVGIGALLAPPIGAAVGGAVLGAVGTGGIVGGVFAASKDAGVRVAAKDLAAFVSQEFFHSGQAFVEPVKNSLGILKTGYANLHLGEAFARIAPSVERLAEGLVEFGTEAMPGVNKALEAAGPIIGVLADELPQLGDAFGDMLTDMSKSKGVIGGFHFALDAVEAVLRGTGDTVRWLGDRFEEMARIQARVTGGMEDIFGWVPWVGDRIRQANDHAEDWVASMDGAAGGAKKAARHTSDFARYLGEAAVNADALNLKLDDLFGRQLGADEALLRMKKGILDLTAALKDNRGAWGLDTEAGVAHRQAVIDAIADTQRWRDAMRANGVPAAEANRLYEEQIKKIERIGVQAGITKTEMDKLAGKYEVSVLFSTVGAPPPRMRLSNLYVMGGELPSRDMGGPVTAGRSYRIGGKTGPPEILTMGSQSGQVSPAGGGVTISFAATGDRLLDAIIRELRSFIRIEGGTGSHSVQVALGQ